MGKDRIVILKAKSISKKFPKSLRANMVYGFLDFFMILFNRKLKSEVLRKGEFWALRDINFELNEREILAIVGVNGSGKTTLMRIIAQIYKADLGSVQYEVGKRITSLFALKTGMHPLFTGRENVYVKGSMYGMTKEEIDGKMDFIIEFSELDGFMDMPFGNYSSGMSARLAFAIGIATDPDLLILDEALAVGDFIFRTKCISFIEKFASQPNKSVLVVTNDPRKVRNIASRMMILKKGKQIYESENIREVMEYFIMNCVEGMDEIKKEKYLKNIRRIER